MRSISSSHGTHQNNEELKEEAKNSVRGDQDSEDSQSEEEQ